MWARLKRDKLQMEAQIQVQSGVRDVVKQLQAQYQREVEEARAGYAKGIEDLRNHLTMMENELWDYEILIKLKQGQVEVPEAAVVTDFSDAVVFSENVIKKRNDRINVLGDEKVQILHTIKEFRKKINLLVVPCSRFQLLVVSQSILSLYSIPKSMISN